MCVEVLRDKNKKAPYFRRKRVCKKEDRKNPHFNIDISLYKRYAKMLLMGTNPVQAAPFSFGCKAFRY